jgi:hypothetical protein
VEVCVHKTSLTPPLFIEVSVTCQESEWSCICVLVVSILPLSAILIFYYGIVPAVWYFIVALLQQCGILLWHCSSSVVFYCGIVPAVWHFIVALFQQCGILLWHCSSSVVFYYGTVPAVWYFIVTLLQQ